MSLYKKYLFDEKFVTPKFKPEEKLLERFPVEDFVIPESLFDPSLANDNDKFYDLILGVDIVETDHNGNLVLRLTHNSGSNKGKIWAKSVGTAVEDFTKHNVFKFNGKFNEWPKGSKVFGLDIYGYTPHYPDNPSELLPVINESRTSLRDELLYYLSKLSEPVQELAYKMLDDVWEQFVIRPAAMGMHHYQLGGLLQHTVEIMRIAATLLESNQEEQETHLDYVFRLANKALWDIKKRSRQENNYAKTNFYEKEEHLFYTIDSYLRVSDEIDYDVAIFSILFHDIGKLLEYTHFGDDKNKYNLWFPGNNFELTPKFGVNMDDIGAKIGHISLGIMFLHKYWSSNEHSVQDQKFWLDAIGCISSHHGKKEWGSPTTPKTGNEWLVHLCDLIDARFAGE